MERWVGEFAEVGQELAEPSADGCVSFHLAGPAAFNGVVDELLFTCEPSSQSWSILAGGEDGAPEVEVAFARAFLR